jgi:hypothetical protein
MRSCLAAIHRYPSAVCVIALGADSNAPSCTLQTVCLYWVIRVFGSSAVAARVANTSVIQAVAIDLGDLIPQLAPFILAPPVWRGIDCHSDGIRPNVAT